MKKLNPKKESFIEILKSDGGIELAKKVAEEHGLDFTKVYGRWIEAIDTLSNKELDIILARNQKKTLEEIGKVFGVTRGRIRQIEAKAHEKIRQVLKIK